MIIPSPKSLKATQHCVWLALLVSTAALCAGEILAPAWAGEARTTNESTGRYLFIVDTSSTMSRRAENTQKLVGDLLLSGLNGQLRPGDTIGVWTFNEKLNAGNFPLQRWLPQARQRIASGVVDFLRNQRYEKQAQIDKTLGPMLQVVKNSDKITVLLISDGDDKLSGTPFDNEINEASKLNYAPQRKLRMPTITVLRARKGGFIGWKVCAPPWPLEFPEFPAEPQAAKAPVSAETPKQAPKPPPKPPTVPSLVVVGQKPESTATPTNTVTRNPTNPDSTSATQPALKPASSTVPTTSPGVTPATKSPAPGSPQVKSPEGSVVPTIGSTQQQVAVVPSAPGKPENVSPPKTSGPTAQSPQAITGPNFPNAQIPPNPTASVEVTNGEGPTASSPIAKPMASAREESLPPTQTVVQVATAAPSETIFNRTGILIAVMVLLLGALGLVYVFMRRSRTTERISLITRSMDRDNKK